MACSIPTKSQAILPDTPDDADADGSEKLPIRLFPRVEAAREDGRNLNRPAIIVAAWM